MCERERPTLKSRRFGRVSDPRTEDSPPCPASAVAAPDSLVGPHVEEDADGSDDDAQRGERPATDDRPGSCAGADGTVERHPEGDRRDARHEQPDTERHHPDPAESHVKPLPSQYQRRLSLGRYAFVPATSVSRMTSTVRVGVLALHDSKESKAICNAVEALGHAPEWFREENTTVRIDRTDGGSTVRLEPDVDVVINRLLLSNTDQPMEELGIAWTVAVQRPILNPPEATAVAAHKLATASLLAREGLPVPDTLLALSATTLNAHRREFGPEAVYKTAIGTHGGGAWKVDTDDTLTAKVGKRRAFLQRLLGDRDEPRDARVYVVGDRIVGSMYRYAAGEDWRTNVHLGGRVEDVTDRLPEEAAEIARRAASVVGLDYAGVDLIEEGDQWYVLEVNPTAGFRGLYRATGVSPAPYIAALALERVGVDVDDDRVRDLAATLDDSPPSCMPRPDPTDFDEPPVIGFTERVVVSGTAGTKTVIGKADSGAARTSIDLSLAADIGAGPIHTVSTVRSGSARKSQSRPVVDLVVGIGGTQHTVAANIVDRSHMSHPLLIGRDVLKHYFLDISRRVEDPSTYPLDDERTEE